MDVRSFRLGLLGVCSSRGMPLAGLVSRPTFNSQLRTGTDRGNPTV